ncbi:hypothetical protein [Streptacidiphilus sp. MAP5-3]|uniref:hypothetical protein n=1 Tax=unclassified Streptacidiphilus TaxID=2643834 RepID=UPI003512ACAC
MARNTMTPEERAAYGAQMRAELESIMDRAYAAMTTDPEFWAAVMRTAAILPDRSTGNAIAITAQCPQATCVKAAADWRKVGRGPAKGSRSLRIWTPIKRRVDAEQGEGTAAETGRPADAPAESTQQRVSGFKAGPVFDLSQTDGDAFTPPAPEVFAAEVLRDVLVTQYRKKYNEDPEASSGIAFQQEAPDDAVRILLYGHAWRRIPAAESIATGQHEAEVTSAAHVAALILGINPGPAVMPPLAGILTDGKKPPVYGAAVRAVEAGRLIAAAVTADARELAGAGQAAA